MQKPAYPLLFTPGPVSVSPNVLAAGGLPMIHHRSPEFHPLLENVTTKMKQLFGTKDDVLMIHSTGRGAMEGVLRNLFSPKEKIACVCNGKFGQMFAEIAESCGLIPQRICTEWLVPVIPEEIDALLQNDPDIKGVTVVHSDTSTAVMNPIADIGQIVRRHDRLLVVDCISTLGVMAFSLDDLKADAAVTASQKGLMSPAGISFAAINQRAWAAVERTANPSFTVDLKRMKKFYDEKRETPGSTPVSLVASVNVSLEMIFEEGLQNVHNRHGVISRAIKCGVQGMGLTLLPEGNADRSHAVTLIKAPDGIEPALIKTLARDKYGIMIASGLGELKDISFRIGHIGMVGVREALLVVSALELILRELGIAGKPGNGLEAFYESLDRETDDC